MSKEVFKSIDESLFKPISAEEAQELSIKSSTSYRQSETAAIFLLKKIFQMIFKAACEGKTEVLICDFHQMSEFKGDFDYLDPKKYADGADPKIVYMIIFEELIKFGYKYDIKNNQVIIKWNKETDAKTDAAALCEYLSGPGFEEEHSKGHKHNID